MLCFHYCNAIRTYCNKRPTLTQLSVESRRRQILVFARPNLERTYIAYYTWIVDSVSLWTIILIDQMKFCDGSWSVKCTNNMSLSHYCYSWQALHNNCILVQLYQRHMCLANNLVKLYFSLLLFKQINK